MDGPRRHDNDERYRDRGRRLRRQIRRRRHRRRFVVGVTRDDSAASVVDVVAHVAMRDAVVGDASLKQQLSFQHDEIMQTSFDT